MLFFRLFTLCSVRAIALVFVLSESPSERIGKWETCPILKENRSLVLFYLEHLWQSLPHYKEYRERQFLRFCRHTRFMGRQHQLRGTVGENQHWEGLFRKITELLLQRWQRNEYSSEDPVSKKTVRREVHKSNIRGRAAIAKPLITESSAQMCKRWCHDHKTWTSDNFFNFLTVVQIWWIH
jgi:hypothetical protein